MSGFANKLANSITNATGSLIGRDNLTKLTNSINKTFMVHSEFRNYLKAGNVVQLISKSTHMALQICTLPGQPGKLVLNGSGPVGAEATHAHFTIEAEPDKAHFKFRNAVSYVAYDNQLPCVLSQPGSPPNAKQEMIRTRNEFRVHEIIGSKEYFTLESVYFPGQYVYVMSDGTVTSTKNKADEHCFFCLNVVSVLPQNLPKQGASGATVIVGQPAVQQQPSTSSGYAGAGGVTSSSSQAQKEMEAAAAALQAHREREEQERAAAAAAVASDAPPAYQHLYPQLPRQ